MKSEKEKRERKVSGFKKQEELLQLQLRQQEAVTKLGLMALSGTGLGTLMKEAVLTLKKLLNVEYTKILELLPDGKEAILRAGEGWNADIVIDRSTVSTGKNSQAGYTLASKKPVIVKDLRTEKRFNGPPLLVKHHVVSGMSCVIWGRNNKPYGVLGIHTTKRRDFTSYDVNFLQAIANILATTIQRKQDGERLQESEERFRASFHEAAIAMSITDLDGKWLILNKVYQELFGYTAEELKQLDFLKITHPDDREKDLSEIVKLIRGEVSTLKFEKRYLHKNGSVVWGMVHLSTIKDAKGNPKSIIAAIKDITERKQTEEKLKYQKSLLEAQQEVSPMGIVVVSQEGEIISYNQLFMAMWDFPSEVIEKKLDEVALQAAKEQLTDPEGFLKIVRETYESGAKSREKLVFKDGRIFERYGSPVRSEEGVQYGYVWFFQDITEQEALTRQKDDFIGIVSHELRTPVTSIKAYTQILQDRFRTSEDKLSAGMLAKMDIQIDKLTKLITDLLDVTKIEQGKLQFRQETFQFNALVREIVDEVQRTTQKHTLILELAQERMVHGNRDRIGQVITNLLTNAIKYSQHADKVIVRTGIKNGELIFSVQDFGLGLSEEDQERVFERFYRVGDSRSETYPGLGLGLYICSDIIHRHNGNIWVESKKGEGSIFYFSLPSSPYEDNDMEGIQ